jgi:hypothetical protein
MMLDAEVPGGRGDLRFVVFLLGKSDRERLHLLTMPANESREDCVRIDPATQEQTKWDIAARRSLDTFVQLRTNYSRFLVAALNLARLRVRPISPSFCVSGARPDNAQAVVCEFV